MEDVSNSDSVYFAEVERLSNWCRDNSLDLNVKKTKEMLTEFRKAPNVIPDLFIDGVKAKGVIEYKYLGTFLGNKQNFNKNTDFIHKNVSQEYLAFKSSLNVSAAALCTVYLSCTESVLTFSFLCWFGGLKSKNVLNEVVNVCGKVVAERQEQLSHCMNIVWYGRLG